MGSETLLSLVRLSLYLFGKENQNNSLSATFFIKSAEDIIQMRCVSLVSTGIFISKAATN